MRIAVVTFLGIALSAGPVCAQQPDFSLLRAARAEAARQAASTQAPAPAQTRGEMSPALKWTGIGLLIGGGALLLSGVLVDDACVDEGEFGIDYCEDVQTAWVATGAAAAGAGGVLLLIGNANRQPAPSAGFGGRRILWRIRF